jgi:arginine N-succinyltransferase
MMLVRPATLADHAEILALAHQAGIGMTSLPPDADVLEQKIRNSVESCHNKIHADDKSFLFVLVDTDTNALVGTTGIAAHVGMKRPFYSYKLSTLVQASANLDIYSHQRVLHMVNDYTGATEIGSLFLLPQYRRDGIGNFLSRCRYLMLAEFPDVFSDIVIAEIRGVQDENGDSPFYKNVAQQFFQMEFRRADFIHATQGGQFISDLMPKYPVYVDLLDEKAQVVIGVPFAASLPAKHLLEREGFRHQGYIDVFDAGPTMQAERAYIRTVRKSKRAQIVEIRAVAGEKVMMSTTELPYFHMALSNMEVHNSGVVIDAKTAEILKVKVGAFIRYMVM